MCTLVLQVRYSRDEQQLLQVGYNAETEQERISNGNWQILFTVQHKNGLLITQWNSHLHHNCSQRYDR